MKHKWMTKLCYQQHLSHLDDIYPLQIVQEPLDYLALIKRLTVNPEGNFSRDYFASSWQVCLGTQQFWVCLFVF